MDNHYNHFKKIDAHSHIGKFGSPFNIDFDLQRLTEQMEAYISKRQFYVRQDVI